MAAVNIIWGMTIDVHSYSAETERIPDQTDVFAETKLKQKDEMCVCGCSKCVQKPRPPGDVCVCFPF